jgi:hypothetical protein
MQTLLDALWTWLDLALCYVFFLCTIICCPPVYLFGYECMNVIHGSVNHGLYI